MFNTLTKDDINLVLPTDGNAVVNGIYTTERLLQRAESGERLNAEDRRSCIGYLMIAKPHLSNVSLASKFSVSESCIRKDKATIDGQRSREVFEEDAQLVIYRVIDHLDRQVSSLEESKDKCKKGSRDYVLHCKAIAELSEKRLRILQDLGYVPTNIGANQTQQYEYAAIVLKGDQVETRRIEQFDDKVQKQIAEKKNNRINSLKVVEPPALPAPTPDRQVVYVKKDIPEGEGAEE